MNRWRGTENNKDPRELNKWVRERTASLSNE